MIDQAIVYAPCPCGSGKKFKFCCFKKYRAELSDDMTQSEVTEFVRLREKDLNADTPFFKPGSMEAHFAGYDLMKSEKFAKARAKFKESREIDPTHSASWNNEASCAWEMGDYTAACDIQREGNANMTATDSFGLARLAIYAHVTGLEDEAVKSLEAALAVPPVSVDGAIEVCRSLALYHRHRDIIDFVEKSGMKDDPLLIYYVGVAWANLGDFDRAQAELEKVKDDDEANMERRYLKLMKDFLLPQCPEGEDDWPYFCRWDFAPARYMLKDVRNGDDPFARCPKAVAEDCIVFLLAEESLSLNEAKDLADRLTSDRARRISAYLEEELRYFAEDLKREVAERAADVDAQGRIRVRFDPDPDGYSEMNCLDDDELDWMDYATRLLLGQIPAAEADRPWAETRLCILTERHPQLNMVNYTYFDLIALRDPELANCLRESYFAAHPDDTQCAGFMLSYYAKSQEFEKAAAILDRFALPDEEVDGKSNINWSLTLISLYFNLEFREKHPDAHARVGQFLKWFSCK